jgi:predicted amidophosphoribosyltransferase
VVKQEGERMAADVIVPVPLRKQRAPERGFNQDAVFGRPLARRLGLPYKPVLLVRSRPPARRSIYLAMRSARKPYVAHLQCKKAVGLTIYESCC